MAEIDVDETVVETELLLEVTLSEVDAELDTSDEEALVLVRTGLPVLETELDDAEDETEVLVDAIDELSTDDDQLLPLLLETGAAVDDVAVEDEVGRTDTEDDVEVGRDGMDEIVDDNFLVDEDELAGFELLGFVETEEDFLVLVE